MEEIWFGIIRVVLYLVSAVASSCMLLNLSRATHVVRQRLFWKQLVALASVDLIQGVVKAIQIPIEFYGKYAADTWQHYALGVLHDSPDFASSFVEVCIAAGFAAAAAGFLRAAPLLRVVLPVGIGVNILYAAVLEWSHDTMLPTWSSVLAGYFLLAFLLYLSGFVFTIRAPVPVRRQALLRSGSFATSFGITNAPILFPLVFGIGRKFTEWEQWLFALNGAMNASAYAYWALQKRVESDLSVDDIESAMLRCYFDLDSLVDDDLQMARRQAVLAAARAQQIRSLT